MYYKVLNAENIFHAFLNDLVYLKHLIIKISGHTLFYSTVTVTVQKALVNIRITCSCEIKSYFNPFWSIQELCGAADSRSHVEVTELLVDFDIAAARSLRFSRDLGVLLEAVDAGRWTLYLHHDHRHGLKELVSDRESMIDRLSCSSSPPAKPPDNC